MSRKIFLFLMVSILATPAAVYSQQTFQQAVFVHKTSHEKQIFKKGQKLKVVCEYSTGAVAKYKGKLNRIAGDSIFLDVKRKEIGLPLAHVVKIQKAGMPLFFWFGVIGGLILLFLGILLKAIEDTSNIFRPPLGLQENRLPHTGFVIIGALAILAGLLLSFKPSVKHPTQDWMLRTEYMQPPGQMP